MSGSSGALTRLVFNTADPDNSPNVGAYLRAGSDGDQLTSTLISGKEALDVNLVGSADGGIFAEDSAHTTGDKGVHILAVRNDTEGSLVDADGDYGSLQLDASGRLRVIADIDLTGDIPADGEADTTDPLKTGMHAYDQASVWGTVDAGDVANVASDLYRRQLVTSAPNVGIANGTQTITDVEAILTQSLAGRQQIWLQNQGTNSIFVGATGVTVANGFEINKGMSVFAEIGEAVDIYGIADTGDSEDIRVLELA